ncbi:ATP-binding protein [Streptomyces sp. NPDC088124]|uniref:ATP-binding protein n=1 Tax=Streptomyces sp. NPDC088124 TaxID=3154654 RepID=UPI00342D9E8D
MTTHRAAPSPRSERNAGGITVVGTPPSVFPLTSDVFEMVMEPASVHVAQARGTTATMLRQWALPDGTAEDALLVVSELVTNAINHGSGDVLLRVRHENYQLLIEVKDGSCAPARRRRTGANDHGGRGLLLVACVSLRWGVADGGRTTYAVIPIHTEAPPSCRTTRPTLASTH